LTLFTTTISDEVESSIFLQEKLSLLTSEQKKVIIATILEGHTEQEAAKMLKISQPAVHQMKTRALKRLKCDLIGQAPRLDKSKY
jgi:RNA polymerase sigma-B factor